MWMNAGNLLRSVDLMPSVITSPEPSDVNVRTDFSLLVMDAHVLVRVFARCVCMKNIYIWVSLTQHWVFSLLLLRCLSWEEENFLNCYHFHFFVIGNIHTVHLTESAVNVSGWMLCCYWLVLKCLCCFVEVLRPVDPCQTGTHDCDVPERARCSYTGGSSYICSCLQGFMGDGRTCRGVYQTFIPLISDEI